MQYHPIDDSHLVFTVGGERGAHGSLILGTWRYEGRRLRTVQLSLVVAGRGAVDLEMTAAGALRFAEELDSHARTIAVLNEEKR